MRREYRGRERALDKHLWMLFPSCCHDLFSQSPGESQGPAGLMFNSSRRSVLMKSWGKKKNPFLTQVPRFQFSSCILIKTSLAARCLFFIFGGKKKQIFAQWACFSLWWESAEWGTQICKGLMNGRVLNSGLESHLLGDFWGFGFF